MQFSPEKYQKKENEFIKPLTHTSRCVQTKVRLYTKPGLYPECATPYIMCAIGKRSQGRL